MKTATLAGGLLSVGCAFAAQGVEFRTTTFAERWLDASACVESAKAEDADLRLDLSATDQAVLGFGVCASELSWNSLSALSEADRKSILDEMFSKDGGSFSVIRTPIGASDFATDFYSYSETPGDFAMEKFSIERDRKALLPLLKEILARNDGTFKVWASPWCPPLWMKKSGAYASKPQTDPKWPKNDCSPAQQVHEGEDGFLCDDAHFAAYAKYFRKYVDAYRAEGVPVWMVMPQNEFNSDQVFPSCTWQARSLATFVGKYLGPALEGSGTELYFGTMERPSLEMARTILDDPDCRRYVKGAGFQWAGKGAIGKVREMYPGLTLVQTEQECGDGRNDWRNARHSWELMRHYFRCGVSYYCYWNLSLVDNAMSRWGWRQNSLVSVVPSERSFTYNVEYHVLKHLSHYVKRGARRMKTKEGDWLAFINPDGSVVVAFGNSGPARKATVAIGERAWTALLPADSVSTLVLPANAADVEVIFYTPSIARIVRAPGGDVVKKADIVTAKPQKVKTSVLENDDAKTWKSAELSVRLDKKTGGLSFLRPDGSVMLEEAGPAKFKQETFKGGYTATKVSQRWKVAKDAPVYGLGSVQNGRLDQRNVGQLRLQPENCNDGIPFLCGVGGWGLYWDNVSITWYKTDDKTVGFESDVGDAEDYYFIAGGSLDGVVGAMRNLTGKVPMNALWSYGFWQSRERYTDCGKLLEVLRRYRKDGVPIDGIIQDWQYWGDNDHWNAMEFLNPGFAGAKEMIDEIHASNCHFIISIWCSFGPKTKPYADFEEHGELLALPTYPTVSKPYDCYSAEARERYWKHVSNLFGYGLDGWWMDSTEPEPWGQKEENNDEVVTALGRFRDVRLAYPFYAIRNVHDHTKAARPDRRVFILTRSASAGLQRTGAHTWSGDTDCTWEFLRKQIPCGLNFSLSGNPNWSNDLGGFKSAKRETFSELYARWMQYGVFQPMMRSHGTGLWRELYLFGKPGEPLYDSLLASVKLRYRFLPRVYSIAHEAYASNMSFMRPLVAGFPEDRRTWDEKGSFLFGRDILVSPVTSSNVTTVATYLPQGADWYNYFTGERVKGGAEHEMKTDLSNFPMYVRAGAIVVDGPDVQYVGEKSWDNLAVTVYPGADGSFELYEDAGDGYKYEKGEFTTIRFAWDDKTKTLTIGARKDAYPGMLKSRTFRVKTLGGVEKTVQYDGRAVTVPLDE